MEPITTAAITTLLAHWGGKAFENVFETSISEFTKDSVKWLKGLFHKGDKPSEVLEKYEEKPDSPARQEAVKAAIAVELEDNPQAQQWLMELASVIEKQHGTNNIINSQNVVTAPINAGGSVIVGNDNNSPK